MSNFLKFKTLCLLLWAAVVVMHCEAEESDDGDTQKQLESLARVEATIERLKNAPLEEAMPKLGEILEKTARQNIYQVEERWRTHEKAKAAILAFPRHAEFFRDEMKRIKSDWRDRGNEPRYDSARVTIFETLKFLPSPEVISLLGDLLEDDEDEPPEPSPYQDYADYSANSMMALIALNSLIDKSPTANKKAQFTKADLHVWKLWFAQVKAGTKGFQFKGSDTVHYLATPAKEERRPVASEPGTPVPEKRAIPVERKDAPKDESRKVPLVAILVALGLLALSAAWVAISKRGTNAGT